MKHLATSLLTAAGAALASAFAVLWVPSLPGKVITGAALAYWLGHSLRKHRLARKGSEAMLAGTAAAVAALVWLPAAMPLAVFVILALPSVAHYTNPRRQQVVRTTRGVRTPARKAAGGRAGRPGEVHRPRARRPGSSSSGQQRPRPSGSGHAAGSGPSGSPPPAWPPAPGRPPAASWPHATADVPPSTFLP